MADNEPDEHNGSNAEAPESDAPVTLEQVEAEEVHEADAEPGSQPEPEKDPAPQPQQQPGPSPEGEADAAGPQPNAAAFSWEASEFVHHHKDVGWYVVLFGAVGALVAATVFLHSWLEMVALLAMTGAIVVYARKPPRTLRYELMHDGVVIDGRQFPFSDFRSFGVVEDAEWHSVDLEPAKRFRPRMTMLFGSEDLPEIVGHLEQHLPREDRQLDLIEQVTRYLRF